MKTFQLQKLIIETDSMTSQHFGSNSFPFRLNQRNRVNRKARVDRNKRKQSHTYFHFFFFYISHRHYMFGLKGRLCWIVSHFFPCRGALLQCSNSKSTEESESHDGSTQCTESRGIYLDTLELGCCEVQTISFSIPTYSSYLSFTTLANKQW